MHAVELFKSVVLELLTQTIHVIRGVVDRVKCTVAFQVLLHCFGNSIPLTDLYTVLETSMPRFDVSINNLMPWISQVAPRNTTPRSTARSKLAIVGISCRLPEGARQIPRSSGSFWRSV